MLQAYVRPFEYVCNVVLAQPTGFNPGLERMLVVQVDSTTVLEEST